MSNYCGDSACLNPLNFLPAPPVRDKFRQYEQLSLRIRSFAGLKSIHDRLDPYGLAKSAGLRVIAVEDIQGLSDKAKALLKSPDIAWSGGATPMLPDGSRIVILNPSQSQGRKAATLMEEVCHVLLGHTPSQISAGSQAQRTYNQQIEEEAYSVGAAALLPYRALLCSLLRKRSIRTIASQAGVTQSLVRYRIKILRLTSHLI
ncbi:MAG: ImmA/IrrE family metallo-endopeptidase [Acidobacteria bacterium]|nr:ImmA/IrrE family metallo-endopeptidase [Acidobacteriota bacterium]